MLMLGLDRSKTSSRREHGSRRPLARIVAGGPGRSSCSLAPKTLEAWQPDRVDKVGAALSWGNTTGIKCPVVGCVVPDFTWVDGVGRHGTPEEAGGGCDPLSQV